MRTLILLCIFAVAAIAAPQPAAAQVTTTVKRTTYALIRCESPGGRSSFCPADTRRGVQLTRDLNGRCRLGRTWGYTARGIWVSGGCAGEFEIGRRSDYGYGWGYTSDTFVVCASEDYRRSFCPAPTGRGVRLVNQISEAPCVRGRTWWRDERGIVVTHGCAGEFQVGYRDSEYRTPPARGAGAPYRPDSFVCASQGPRRRYCPADINYGAAQLMRRIGAAPCIYGRNWGYDPQGVWVQGGCAAEFRVGYAEEAFDPREGARWIRCESRDYTQTRCETGRNRGVTMARQVSNAECVEGDTWGFDRNGIWVTEGCAADFEVR